MAFRDGPPGWPSRMVSGPPLAGRFVSPTFCCDPRRGALSSLRDVAGCSPSTPSQRFIRRCLGSPCCFIATGHPAAIVLSRFAGRRAAASDADWDSDRPQRPVRVGGCYPARPAGGRWDPASPPRDGGSTAEPKLARPTVAEEARMTSEGQQAGQQPAEATSGGPAGAFGPDGFPPDSDSSGRGSAPPVFPTSYAPPPQSTPNGGSPFVVPTVFGPPAGERPFPEGSAFPDRSTGSPDRSTAFPDRAAAFEDRPVDRFGIPTAQPGSGQPADRGA